MAYMDVESDESNSEHEEEDESQMTKKVKRESEKGKTNKKKKKKEKTYIKSSSQEIFSFHEMELDDRLCDAIANLGWETPSEIQGLAVPTILRGRDVVMKARTGSGKTGAYGIPLIQRIIDSYKTNPEKALRALVLVPSVELCMQTCKNLKQLSSQCSNITTLPLTSMLTVEEQLPLIELGFDIVVGTPARVLEHLKAGSIEVSSMEMLVVDEADVIFLLGLKETMLALIKFLPKTYQTVMASATMPAQVKWLTGATMYEPIYFNTDEDGALGLPRGLKHFYLLAKEEDKAFSLYAMLKLQLIKGRTLIFVNTVDKCYKLKLFLEQFGIKSCVVNSELPALVRMHVINQFNSEQYDIVIASDEFANNDTPKEKKDKKKTKRRKDSEFNAARGIDFQNVSNVLLFDFPLDEKTYVHRAGRTARMQNEGTVLSFVGVHEKPKLERINKKLQKTFNTEESVVKELEFDARELDGFRYRSGDAWRAVTRVAVREARLKEIKQELFNCKALKGYFEDNPRDFNTLRHDKSLHTVKQQSHLRHVPLYLVPQGLRGHVAEGGRPAEEGPEGRPAPRRRPTHSEKMHKRKTNDPLSAQFSFKRRKDGESQRQEEVKDWS